ncbi:uncharacterized protein LOC126633799 [Malus sylvestris]|uniref:uncharacterized protein LOC126633799 n=1 Tax=Malus sylvestris TaxID=3752 RepID=UPI0021AC2D84|nr:uncharacterized protein LOC126633799 [Malus sylvestris]
MGTTQRRLVLTSGSCASTLTPEGVQKLKRTTLPAARSSNVTTPPLGAAPTPPSSSRRHPNTVTSASSARSQRALKNMASSSKKDFAWQWTKDLDPVTKHFYCVFCNHKCTGSISRFKHHLGGVSSGGMINCKKVPPNVKEECYANVMATKEKRKASHELCRGGGEESESVDMGTKGTPYVSSGSGSATYSQQTGSFLPPRSRGPLDRYVALEARQATLNTPFKKEERRQASRALARWFYTSAIPFNAANNEHYVNAMKLVSNFGPGFNAPTSHEYRTWMLKEEVEDVQNLMKEHQKAWKRYGCTIMSDGKSRCLINFLVNSPQGTWFLKSIDASASIKNGDLLYGYLDDVIQEVGEENVVQVISDNASNYKNAGSKLMERKEKVWWTPCAAHCIDLMLEDISKMTWFDDTLKRARCISKYLYGHQWVLALMRKYTNNSEILRPAVTRFATSFLTLQSLQKQKDNLVALFASQEWLESTYAKSREAKLAKHHVLHDREFWG